jgi:hypothetical protein
MKTHLTYQSKNQKTGPIPVSTSSSCTCPDACPFKGNGCYGDGGPLQLHWRAVTNETRGTSWQSFVRQIFELPSGQLWRHNQVGDLPGLNNDIDRNKLEDLVIANKGKRGFTYTHKPPTRRNLELIHSANEQGFTINLSANGLDHADRLVKTGLPVTVVLPSEDVDKRSQFTPAGHKVVTCPAARSERINCSTCALCQKQDRGFIIGFPAHGARKSIVSKIVRQVSHTTHIPTTQPQLATN